VARCSVCSAPAIAYVPYQRRYYCPEHFAEFVERKVRRTVEKYKMLRRGDRVVAMVSGGKDSATLLSTLSGLREEIGFELYAFHIDLGIGDYSVESKRTAVELSRRLGVPLVVFSLREELGYGVPEAAIRLRRPACSVCGIFKRYLYNAVGVELGAKVATGHNADDLAAYSLKNFLFQELEAIGKLGPVQEGVPGLAATRIRPLYTVYEKESFLYTVARDLPFLHRECPHARLDSLDFRLKDMLNRLEEERPSLKLGLLSRLAKRAGDYPRPSGSYTSCESCGLLSSGGKCSFCRLTEKLSGEPLGGWVRKRIRELFSWVTG